MSQDWIIDVLAGLRQHAIRNDHLQLAEQLDNAIVVAATEVRLTRAEDDAHDRCPTAPPARVRPARARPTERDMKGELLGPA